MHGTDEEIADAYLMRLIEMTRHQICVPSMGTRGKLRGHREDGDDGELGLMETSVISL